MALYQSRGHLSLLRVHKKGSRYGPSDDELDVEVVVWLDTEPGKAFGFQLRDDGDRPARQGMLDLLRDAFNHAWTTTIDYELGSGKSNGVILRVWLTR